MRGTSDRPATWRPSRVAASATWIVSLVSAIPAIADDPPDFARDIQPVLAARCFECHGADSQEAGLRLDERPIAVAPLESGVRAIVPGDPQASHLLERVTSDDPDLRMPPDDEPLNEPEIALLRAWIENGAAYEVHWAYRPLDPGIVPAVRDGKWPVNALDSYVLATLESREIAPAPEADRITLIKRLYYDLLGLPPPPDHVDAFLADERPDAYARLVDRVLASPHFGERWGRHWLDMARYADSDGYEKDNPRPDAWRYRDWVIGAMNDDLSYDTFTIQQLAGDLLPGDDPAAHLATAFHRQTLTNTEGGTDKEEFRVAAVMDRTETLGMVWLGLTVGCARCHNHKYDRLEQDEYYALFAFLNNGDETTAQVPRSPDSGEGELMEVRVVTEREEDRRVTHVLRRGDFLQPLHAVEPRGPRTLPPISARDGERPDRLDLAHWLVSGSNPLPPRVAVNQIWSHLFRHGLVRTMNDFGVRGELPTHPQLLDYLATELVGSGWSRKSLIRTIVMSRTYRQSSDYRSDLAALDPQNRWLARQNRFRVEAEIIRDLSLAASGLLDRRIGGPSVFPPIPPGITDLTYNSSFKWEVSPGGDRYRRGMYTFFKRTAPHPNLTTFDCPSANVAVVQRDRSNTPLGALVTLNNEVFVESARALARRALAHPAADDRERLVFAWRECLPRRPHPDDMRDLLDLLEVSRDWYREHPRDAMELTGDEEEQEAVETAAWTSTLRVVLNLDEFLVRD